MVEVFCEYCRYYKGADQKDGKCYKNPIVHKDFEHCWETSEIEACDKNKNNNCADFDSGPTM